MEVGPRAELFADDGDESVVAREDSYLGFRRVFAGPEEGFDAQVLLDPRFSKCS